MKTKYGTRLLILGLMLAMLVVPVRRLTAVTENTERMGNIIGTATGTLLKGFIQGKIHSFKDVAKCLGYGAVAGFGFYQAKSLVGNGHVFAGVLTANLSYSVVENVAAGHGPLAFVSFMLPLLNVQIATPLARDPDAVIRLSLDTMDFARLIGSFSKADKVRFQDGLLSFVANKTDDANVLGWTSGLFPTVLAGQGAGVYRHEVVHVIQSIQLSAVSPEPFVRNHAGEGRTKLFAFSGIRLQALDSINGLTMANIQGYKKDWREVEAYHFAF